MTRASLRDWRCGGPPLGGGEALTQAQRVGMEHPLLGPMLKSGGGDARAAAKRLTTELAEKHARRMTGLGLTA